MMGAQMRPPTEAEARKQYGENVRIARKRRKLNQTELGRKIGVKRAHLSNLERGKYWPTVAVARKVFAVLRVKLPTTV